MTATRRFAAITLASLALAAAAAAGESWTVASGEVRVRCRLTVGGSFDAVTPQISGSLLLDDAGGRRGLRESFG